VTAKRKRPLAQTSNNCRLSALFNAVGLLSTDCNMGAARQVLLRVACHSRVTAKGSALAILASSTKCRKLRKQLI